MTSAATRMLVGVAACAEESIVAAPIVMQPVIKLLIFFIFLNSFSFELPERPALSVCVHDTEASMSNQTIHKQE
jgi:hypothetical protein